jgi:hypothetical protein
MLYRIIAAGACVLALAGCQQSGAEQSSIASPTAPTSLSAATVERSLIRPAVPFSGVVTGEAAFDFANPRGCPSAFTTITDAKGTASHLGVTVFHSDHCVSMDNGAIVGGVLVLTAANGDEIHATYTGSSGAIPTQIGDPISVTGAIQFEGGTGRFLNASGTAVLTAEVTFEGFGDLSWAGRWEWKGSIRY